MSCLDRCAGICRVRIGTAIASFIARAMSISGTCISLR
jgi:hypothetical protein